MALAPTDFIFNGFYEENTFSTHRKWIGIVFNTFPKNKYLMALS
jgi:hypothetical protein